MEKSEIETKIKNLIAEFSGVSADALKLDVPVVEQGVDSLSAAELLFEMEDEFGVTSDPGADFLKKATITDLVNLVLEHKK